ncbi:MAG: DUF86 domain-containing protein [Acidobacteria bacterium]|nr:DUF86 domain-containing protein [Acidobacteriota bacterium]MBI3658580.1 DUF86 domain-containing protein [Acidobacteriota bacterium]
MSKRTDQEFLIDIGEALQRIKAYVAGMTYESFVTDPKTQDAVVRNLEILGEAAKNLSDELRAKYPSVPWRSMAGARDRLIHHYFGINLDIIWQIATVELPQVASQLETIEDTTE